jgi:hypothetical protein
MATNQVKLTDALGAEQAFDASKPLSIVDANAAQAVDLCKHWPNAKKWLQLLKSVLTGGAKNFWGPVIDFIVSVGDALCPK